MFIKRNKKNGDPGAASHCSGTLGKIRSLFLPRLRGGDTRGAAAVEFALVFPVFLMFVLGIMEIGRAFWVRSSLQFAVEEAARMAMAKYTLNGWTQTEDEFATYLAGTDTAIGSFTEDVQAEAEISVLGWNPSTAEFTPTYDETSSTLTVVGTVEFNFIIPFVTLDKVNLSASTSTPLYR